MVASKKEQSKSTTTILVFGVIGEIILGLVWLFVTQASILSALGITIVSLRGFLIATTIASLILAVITATLYYRKRENIATAIAIMIVLTAFGVFAATGFAIEIGFRL